MHHLTRGISSLLRSINLILFTVTVEMFGSVLNNEETHCVISAYLCGEF